MSDIVLPAGFRPNMFTLRMQTNQRVFASPYGGSEQVVDMGNDRWMVYLSLPNKKFKDAAIVEAFIASLRGMTNTVQLYHYVRKVPQGTMRGSPVTNGAFAGTDSMIIGTTPGATLKAGDMLGVAGLLLQVRDDAVANGSGVMMVTFVNRFRKYINAGLPVIWDRPTAPFRLVSDSAVQYIPGYAPSVSFDFVEAIQ